MRVVSQNSTCPTAVLPALELACAAAIAACTHVLRSAEGDACDALNVLQAELGDGLASLLLVAGVDGDGRALGDHGIALLLGVAGLILLDLDVLLLGLVGELFNAGVGHFVGLWVTTGVGGAAISTFAELGSELPKMICGRFSAGSSQYTTGNDEPWQSLIQGAFKLRSPKSRKQAFQRGKGIKLQF